MKKSLVAALSVSSLLFLPACGGGGGDNPVAPTPPTTPVDYPLRTAFVNQLTMTGSSAFKVTGNYVETGSPQPITGSGTANWGAMMAAVFEAKPAQKKATTVLGSISVSSTTVPMNSTQYMYYDSNYNPLGYDGVEYGVVTSSNQLPVTAKVGDTGSWYTANRYTTSAKTKLLGTSSTSYVVQADTATTAFLTLIDTEKDTTGMTTMTVTAKYRMTTTGALTAIDQTGVAYGTNPTSITTMTISY